eukprot:2913673-Amphidinium_carterae.1
MTSDFGSCATIGVCSGSYCNERKKVVKFGCNITCARTADAIAILPQGGVLPHTQPARAVVGVQAVFCHVGVYRCHVAQCCSRSPDGMSGHRA